MGYKTINDFNNLLIPDSTDYLLGWDLSASSTVKISIGSLSSSTIISSTLIPDLPTSKITSGTFAKSMITGFQNYDIPTADHSFYGDTITLKTDDSCNFGELRGLDATYNMATVSNPTYATGLVGMATAYADAGADATFLLRGVVTDASWNWTKGAKLYIGSTTGLSSSLLTTSTKIVRIMGYALSSSVIWFEPDKTWIEL